MKLIELNFCESRAGWEKPIYVNPEHISTMVEYQVGIESGTKSTKITMFSGDQFEVSNSVEQIKTRIQTASSLYA